MVTGGTDNHMVLLDVGRRGLTGAIAESALADCGIVVNRNRIPGDPHGPRITSGVRFGTNTLALRGMGPVELRRCAALVDRVLTALVPHGEAGFALDPAVRSEVRGEVARLCREFPLPHHTPDRPARSDRPGPPMSQSPQRAALSAEKRRLLAKLLQQQGLARTDAAGLIAPAPRGPGCRSPSPSNGSGSSSSSPARARSTPSPAPSG
ncbi:hypothetical protein ACFQ0M_40000 [Kitasatospora aburaviensis]